MFAGLVLTSLLVSSPPPAPARAPAPAPAPPHFDDARFELHLGGRAGGRFLGSDTAIARSFGGGLNLGLGVRLWQGLYFEAGVGEAVSTNPERAPSFRHLGSHEGTDAHPPQTQRSPLMVGQILLGLRYEIRTAKTVRVRPSVSLGLTHLHEATVADFVREPGKTLGGIGKFINHRTGLQAGAGMRVPFPERWGPAAPRFSLRVDADFAYYFDALPGRIQAGLGLGLQVVF